LRSQIVTSSLHGGRRYHPYAFTEQGVAMLSSVLRSSRAELLSLSLLFPAGNHCRLVNGHVGIRCANWRRNVELASPVIPE